MGWSSTLTVTSAAASQDLISLATFKADHGITVTTYDTLLSRMITRVSLRIARACGRVFAQETVSEVFWIEQEDLFSPVQAGLAELMLSRYPVISVTSITEGDALLSASEYTVNKSNGLVGRLDTATVPSPIFWEDTRITAVYVAGYATIPSDLEEAASLVVWDRFNAREQDRTIQSKFVDGVDRVEYFKATGEEFSPEVLEIINSYRVPGFR